jgi:hypothetical protein
MYPITFEQRIELERTIQAPAGVVTDGKSNLSPFIGHTRRAFLTCISGDCEKAREIEAKITKAGFDANSVYCITSNRINLFETCQETARLAADLKSALRNSEEADRRDYDSAQHIQKQPHEFEKAALGCRRQFRLVV